MSHTIVAHVVLFISLKDCQSVATEFRDKMDDFKQYVPLIQGLRNPGMRPRHWEMLSNLVKTDVELEPSMTFGRCLELNLQDHIENVLKVAETASKEYAIENVRREDLLCLCLLLK